VSLVHAAAAASRIDTLVNLNAKSALSAAERQEVTQLSTAFCVPSPFTKLQCKSEELPVERFDPKSKIINFNFVEKRVSYILPPGPQPRGPTGAAADADSSTEALHSASSSSAAATATGGSTAADFLRGVVLAAVNQVVAEYSIDDVIQRQRRAGYWPAGTAYAALAFCGFGAKQLASTQPDELSAGKRVTPPPAAVPAEGSEPNEGQAPPASTPPAASAPTYPGGASAEDVWATALITAWLQASPQWAENPRTLFTIRRGRAFLDAVGPAGQRALEKAKATAAR
jgi:hypothetical protein